MSSNDSLLSSPKHSVTLSYAHPDTQPPVYVAGSFTSPPWVPQELTHSVEAEHEHNGLSKFYKNLDIPEGRWQYKYRIGEGDWWVIDKNSESVIDEAGNENNLLVVEPKSKPELYTNPDDVDEMVVVSIPSSREDSSTSPNGPEAVGYYPENSNKNTTGQAEEPSMSDTIVKIDGVITEDIRPSEKSVSAKPNGEFSVSELNIRHGEEVTLPFRVKDPSTSTQETATTAAEVADSAAKLDIPSQSENQHQSPTAAKDIANTATEIADTAVILDSKQGSNTEKITEQEVIPIPSRPDQEAADTAADVADSAADLDGNDFPTSDADHEVEPKKPETTEAPHCSHEKLTSGDVDAESDETPAEPEVDSVTRNEPSTEVNDPSLNPLAADREKIFQQVEKIESRQDEDQIPREAITSSSLKSQSSRGTSPTGSSRSSSVSTQRASVLDSLSEEDDADGLALSRSPSSSSERRRSLEGTKVAIKSALNNGIGFLDSSQGTSGPGSKSPKLPNMSDLHLNAGPAATSIMNVHNESLRKGWKFDGTCDGDQSNSDQSKFEVTASSIDRETPTELPKENPVEPREQPPPSSSSTVSNSAAYTSAADKANDKSILERSISEARLEESEQHDRHSASQAGTKLDGLDGTSDTKDWGPRQRKGPNSNDQFKPKEKETLGPTADRHRVLYAVLMATCLCGLALWGFT
ncbi:MAG: hypothetical protein M1827_006786 [Pycnora praestabilis]|nr:MAG: hypothetical protein M1827_006786 [Pycnora praestabilis]